MATKTEATPWILITIPKALNALRAWEVMEQKYHVIHWEEFSQDVEKYAHIIDAMFVSDFGLPKLTENLFEKMKRLKSIVTVTTGSEFFDHLLLQKFNIKLFLLHDVYTDSCADFAFTLMLTAARRITEVLPAAHGYPAGSSVDLHKIVGFLGRDVTGATLGIVGMGKIGFEVARRATGFRMRTLYHNRTQRPQKDEEEVNASYCPTLESLLPQVDFLVITAPLTDQTRYMMKREQFQMMKTNAIVINIARGKLIDHDHLVEALRNDAIGGAALDVTDPEPLPEDHPLLHMPNVIITPHVGYYTAQARESMCQSVLNSMEVALSEHI